MLAGIEAVEAAPAAIRLIKIGTTIATNTVIMLTGARTALVTTAGFTDVLHAARAARPTLYDSDRDPAPALVDRITHHVHIDITALVHERSEEHRQDAEGAFPGFRLARRGA